MAGGLTTVLTTKVELKSAFCYVLDIAESKKKDPRSFDIAGFSHAPQVGLEPTTLRLTGEMFYNVECFILRRLYLV